MVFSAARSPLETKFEMARNRPFRKTRIPCSFFSVLLRSNGPQDHLTDWQRRTGHQCLWKRISASQASSFPRKLPVRTRHSLPGFSAKKPMMVSSEYHS